MKKESLNTARDPAKQILTARLLAAPLNSVQAIQIKSQPANLAKIFLTKTSMAAAA